MMLRRLLMVVVAGFAARATASPIFNNQFRESSTTSRGSLSSFQDGVHSSSSYDLSDSQSISFGNEFHVPLADAQSDNERASQTLSVDGVVVAWSGAIRAEGRHSETTMNTFRAVEEGTAAAKMELTFELAQETEFLITWATRGSVQQDTLATNESFATASLFVLSGDAEYLSLIHDSVGLNRTTMRELVLPPGTYEIVTDVQGEANAFFSPIRPASAQFFADLEADLTFAPVPEPSAWLLAACAGAGLVARARRYDKRC